MRKLSTLAKSTLVSGAAAAAVFGLAVSPASATTITPSSWTVTGGGTFTGTSSDTVLTDTATGTQLSCTSASASGSAANGTYTSGTGIAKVSSASWTNCSGPFGLVFTVTAKNTPWMLNAKTYDTSGITYGTLSGVEASISGSGCTADFGGSTAGSSATLDVKYTNSTHTLTILGTGNLHAWNVAGSCVGLLNSGDPASYKGDYVLSPATLQLVGNP